MNFQNLSSNLRPTHGLVVLHEFGVGVGLDLLTLFSSDLGGFASTGFRDFCSASGSARCLVELWVFCVGCPCVT